MRRFSSVPHELQHAPAEMRVRHPHQPLHGAQGLDRDGQPDGGRSQRVGCQQPGEGAGDVHVQHDEAGQGAGAPLPGLLQDPAADLEVHLDEAWKQNCHWPCQVNKIWW